MATVKRVTLGELQKEFAEFATKTIPEQKAAVVRGIARSVPMLVQRSPVDTGEYANSWDMTFDEKQALIGNYAPHAPIIELGARPFTPPITPLLAWAKRVLKDPSQPPDYSPEVRKLAWGVRRKIQVAGMEPRNILGNATDEIIRNIRRELELL